MLRSKSAVILIAACNIMLIDLICDPCFGIPNIAISTLEESSTSKAGAIERILLLDRSDFVCSHVALVSFADKQKKVLILHSGAVKARLYKLCIEKHIPLHSVGILDALKPCMTIMWLLCMPFIGFAIRRAERRDVVAF